MKKIILKILLFVLSSSLITNNKTNAQPYPCANAEVRVSEGIPMLFIANEPYAPFAYMSYLGEIKYYREIANAGIHLYQFPTYLGDRGINTASGIGVFRSSVWLGPDKYDFSSIIDDFEKIIHVDPLAKVVIRLHLDPPQWWEMLNKEGSCQLPDGTTFRQCFYADKWKEETGKVLQDCVAWLLTSPYAKYLVGVHVAAGGTEEWVYHYNQYFFDENPVRLNAFRKWLSHLYENDTLLLQKAWNKPDVNFSTAELADISGLNNRNEWRDTEDEQNFFDTFRFHSETIADNIAFFCKIVKEASNNCLLTGAFYGYHYFIDDPRKGHNALDKLLTCPYIDYLSSPNDYNRVKGEDWPPMVAIKSVQMHGKLWMAENDTRTSITTLLKDRSENIAPPGQYENGVWLGPKDMETSVAFLLKNLGRMLTQGYGGWWFDMWGGWFSSPELLDVFAKGQAFYKEYPLTRDPKMNPQVCVITDENLCSWDASYGAKVNLILRNRYSLGKTGAPYDLYLRSDMSAIDQTQYRIIWLMGILTLSQQELKIVAEWRKKGILVLHTNANESICYHDLKKESYENKLSWSSAELRELIKNAGVHIYIDTEDVFYIGCNWMCLNTVNGGIKNIELPFYAKLTNPINKDVIADSTNLIQLTLPANTTILLRIEPL